ncbi:MAG: S8 family serine peptidase, partial [Anaerolineales bacterium]|nr:S8 family serine peptidase [Anaerolineales bacterium]
SNSLCAPSWPPAGGWQEHSKNAVLGDAIGGNNSWTTGEGTQHGYQASERTHDLMVRDGNFDTASTAEPFIEVFSAGNSGTGGLTAPKEAKNLIVTAASNNGRAGDIDGIASFSSVGPAVDGRIVPTIAAPGATIASARRIAGAAQCGTPISGTGNHYAFCSGTSMAAPHTSGAIVLVTEWWRNFNGDETPSPAMAKALLVNGAVDMGTPDIPNNNEGWGRINVTNIISPTSTAIYRDQLDMFNNTGEQYSLEVGIADPSEPLKITIAWSDAPGAVGANPALVNNLDLTVMVGSDTYLGNNFSGGWSVTGGAADTINNLENVYVQNPTGSVIIVVDASNIAGDGVPYNGDTTDQDFVLVCSNCALFPDFALSADPSSAIICAPADAVYDLTVSQILGYDDNVTLSASGNPAGTTAAFTTNPVTTPGTSQLTVGNTGSATAGSYALDVVGVATTSTHTITLGLDLYTAVPLSPTLIAPANGAIDVSFQPTFSWNDATQGQDYLLEVATDMAFANVIISETLDTTSYTPAGNLTPNATYYWRVTPTNVCGDGAASAVYSFTVREAELLGCSVPEVTFTDGIPVTWTVVDNTGGSGIVWTTVSDSACGIGNQTGGSGEAACADSDAAGSGAPAYNTELVTNLIDTTGFSQIDLDFNAYYRDVGAGNDLFKVDVWNGISWINLLTWDANHDGQAVSLDNIVALNDVQFRFTYAGNGFDWYAQVDDVSITCHGSEYMHFLPIINHP